MTIRQEIRHPYDESKGKGRPLRKEDYAQDMQYFEDAIKILNRDVGFAHGKIRDMNKLLIKIGVRLILGMGSIIAALILIILKMKAGVH